MHLSVWTCFCYRFFKNKRWKYLPLITCTLWLLMVRSVLLHIYIPECFILLLSISRVLIRVFVSGLWNFVMIISSWTLLWILSPWKNQSTSSGAWRTPVALQDRRIASPWSTNSAPDSVRAEIIEWSVSASSSCTFLVYDQGSNQNYGNFSQKNFFFLCV